MSAIRLIVGSALLCLFGFFLVMGLAQ